MLVDVVLNGFVCVKYRRVVSLICC